MRLLLMLFIITLQLNFTCNLYLTKKAFGYNKVRGNIITFTVHIVYIVTPDNHSHVVIAQYALVIQHYYNIIIVTPLI